MWYRRNNCERSRERGVNDELRHTDAATQCGLFYCGVILGGGETCKNIALRFVQPD